MPILRHVVVLFAIAFTPLLSFAATPVEDTSALVSAVREGAEGTTIEIGAGTFALEAPLDLKAGMTLKGAGIDQTILTHAAKWQPSTKTLPDPEMKLEGLDTDAYLIRIKRDTAGVTISDMTLLGPQLHGAIFAWFHTKLHLHHLRIKETLWSGVRTFGMQKAKIHDCEFIDAGGRWENGKPGVKGGNTGGGLFAIWMSDTEIYDNRFVRTQMGPADEFYGIKVRQGTRCHVHHNTIETNFSMEFPFENDEDIHRAVASEVFGVPLAEVTREQRGYAKIVNFGIIYGITAHGLVRRIEGLTYPAAEELIKTYNKRFPAIREFFEACVLKAQTQGYVETIQGRRRPIPEIQSGITSMRNYGERLAINSVVQGSAADLIKIAMVRIFDRLKKENRPSKLLLQVHDELVFETPFVGIEAEVAMIRDEMNGAMSLKVPLKVDVGWGKSWGEGK